MAFNQFDQRYQQGARRNAGYRPGGYTGRDDGPYQPYEQSRDHSRENRGFRQDEGYPSDLDYSFGEYGNQYPSQGYPSRDDSPQDYRPPQDYREAYGSNFDRSNFDRSGVDRSTPPPDYRGGESEHDIGRPRQDFRGRGPKGYERSDERIREDVCEQLTRDSLTDASEVSVTVKSGVVTLEGSVGSRFQKHRIEIIADDVSGVKDVLNQLNVTRQERNAQSADSGSATGVGTAPASTQFASQTRASERGQ